MTGPCQHAIYARLKRMISRRRERKRKLNNSDKPNETIMPLLQAKLFARKDESGDKDVAL